MSDLSPRLQWPVPSQNTNPWFDAFVAMVRAIDLSAYGPVREDRNLVLASSATVTFDALTGVLTWSDRIYLLSSPTGYYAQIPDGSCTIADGQVLYAQIVRAPIDNVTLVPGCANQAPATSQENADDTVVLAWRRGSRIYWRNGVAVASGTPAPLVPSGGTSGGAIDVQENGILIGTRSKINFTGLVTVIDDPGDGRVNIDIGAVLGEWFRFPVTTPAPGVLIVNIHTLAPGETVVFDMIIRGTPQDLTAGVGLKISGTVFRDNLGGGAGIIGGPHVEFQDPFPFPPWVVAVFPTGNDLAIVLVPAAVGIDWVISGRLV